MSTKENRKVLQTAISKGKQKVIRWVDVHNLIASSIKTIVLTMDTIVASADKGLTDEDREVIKGLTNASATIKGHLVSIPGPEVIVTSKDMMQYHSVFTEVHSITENIVNTAANSLAKLK